ncbi:PHP domain-containing protein [candidate division KSB1 bacterium]|nr:PHP domain-containing protein [candidate division KSB1 bacterium]
MRRNNIKKQANDVIESNADLHIHSIYSDGADSPLEIIDKAKENHLKAISITDHDNISAFPVGKNYAIEAGVEFIPGVEISTVFNGIDLHLLGYYFDAEDSALLSYIKFLQEERKIRARKIIDKMLHQGIKLDVEKVMKKAYPGSVGRPHIADVLVEDGFVSSYQHAFNQYIGDKCCCFVPKYQITPREAINLVKDAGGLCFIAHPGIDVNDAGIRELIHLGIDGIETIHPRHSPQQISYFRDLIEKYRLLECGGSDCHGNRKKEPLLGKMTISYEVVQKIKQRKEKMILSNIEPKKN